jgi:beta-glucanase (GH16 family)
MPSSSNGEFDMTTDSSNNSYVKNGQLHILPTLTSDVIGAAAVLDGHTFNLTDCTSANYTVCSVVSNASTGAVVPPVMSARLSTKGSASIKYGRVEVRAKIPRGDWIWPSIRMLPTDNVYGAGVMSGEIDVSALASGVVMC